LPSAAAAIADSNGLVCRQLSGVFILKSYGPFLFLSFPLPAIGSGFCGDRSCKVPEGGKDSAKLQALAMDYSDG
jgi:hypothetical protein